MDLVIVAVVVLITLLLIVVMCFAANTGQVARRGSHPDDW